MSDLLEELNTSRFQRQSGTDYNFSIEPGKGAGFTPPQEVMNDNNISLPSESEPRTEPLSEEEMQAFRDAAKAKGIDFDGFIMPNKGTGRSRGNDFITSKVMAAGKAAGLNFDEYQVRSIANDIMGNPAAENFSDQIGLVDFLGLGAFYGAEEGANTAKGGYKQYREYLDKLDSGEVEPNRINLPGTGMNMDLNTLSAGSDMVMGGVEAGLNALTSFPALKGTLVGAKALGKKVLDGARTRKSNRPGGTKLMSGIDGEGIDDAIVAMGDMFTPQVDQDELGFFSKALEEVKNLKQEKGQGSQFKAMLLNSGVKPDELKWTGLDDLLSKKNVTKEELMEHAKNNRVQIRETVLEGPDENTPPSLNFDAGEVLDDYDEYAYEVDYIIDEVIGNVAARGFINEERLEFVEKIDSGLKEKPGYNPAMLEALKKGEFEYTDADGNVVDFQFNVNEIAEELGRERYLENPYMRYRDPDTGYEIVGNDDGYFINTPNGERVSGEDIFSLDEAKVQAETHAMDYGFIQYEGDARYLDYTQDGGENYREILLQNDNFSGDPEYANARVELNKIGQEEFQLRREQGALEFDPVRNSEKIQAIEKQLVELRKQDAEIRTKLPSSSLSSFRENSHFAEDNIIAHVRVKDRKDINGNKVLYIEEFQSDWAQAGGGRKSSRMGFNSPEIQAEFVEKEALEKELNETNMNFIRLYKKKMKGRDLPVVFEFESDIDSGEIGPMAVDRIMRSLVNERSKAYNSAIDPTDPVYAHWYDPELKSFYDDKIIPLIVERDSIKTTTPVPRGPLVEKTDQWVQLGLKRMVRYATENGYDYVAWSPGKIQVDRWNEPGLEQFYDSILPKNSKEVLKKLDKKAKVEVIEIDVSNQMFPEQKTLAIPITDTIRSSAPKGQPLFTPIAATGLGGGLAAQSMNEERQ